MHPEIEQLLRSQPQNGYIRFHLPRYETLFAALLKYGADETRILDIGVSPFTELIVSRFGQADTLGFGEDKAHRGGKHYCFDLNDTAAPSRHRQDLPKYDLIVFAEVLEHLHTAPNIVLEYLSTLLKTGGLMLLQTPNAVSLGKRMRMLIGQNPFEQIRENPKNPGHFREYTRAELFQLLLNGGWRIEHFSYENYFDRRYADHHDPAQLSSRQNLQFMNQLANLLPGSLKPGMFLVAQKPDGD